VTGGASGIGRAIVDLLERDGDEVTVLDVRTGFDVGDPAAWESVGAVELAFLNAGVTTGVADVTSVSDEAYQRIRGANLDGVVFGVRRLAAVMEPGGAIVVTASLAGLVGMERDPLYTLTKHGVIGFVRSVAPQLALQRIRINALCPGYTDTGIVPDELRGVLDVPLMEPAFVAEAALRALNDEETGGAWIAQPNRILQFRFPHIPGPR
jgi:NAD(P)-dependent dehydrogenase (short-subunit alcohol dehydrogenase family)